MGASGSIVETYTKACRDHLPLPVLYSDLCVLAVDGGSQENRTRDESQSNSVDTVRIDMLICRGKALDTLPLQMDLTVDQKKENKNVNN